MEYLLDYGFNEEDLEYLKELYNENVIEDLIDFKDEVISNIKLMASYGILNINLVICENPLIAMLSDGELRELLNGYDKNELVNKLLDDPYIEF